MMISAGRNKSCLLAPALHQLEPEYAAVKFERPFQIGDLQVHVTDVHSWIERTEIFAGCEHISSGGLLKLLAAEDSESVREQAAAYYSERRNKWDATERIPPITAYGQSGRRIAGESYR